MTTTWTFIGSFDGTTETWAGTVDNGTCIADYIEEQLYILWELNPAIRNWERHTAKANGVMYTFFRYGVVEMFIVKIDPNTNTVLVQSI